MMVVEVRPDHVVGVITVRDALVSATGAVLVSGGVLSALMIRRAVGRIRLSDGHLMLVDVTAVDVVQVSVMHVVSVPLVLDRRVPAASSVGVRML
jgi:hypothetical protein